MKEKLYLEQENGIGKTLCLILFALFLALVLLVFSGMFFLSLAYFIKFGFTEHSLDKIYGFWGDFFSNPLILYKSYYKYFANFKFSLVGVVPLFGPLLVIGVTIWAYLKTPNSFRLWYRLKQHFAKPQDVEKMHILDGCFGVLGRYHNQLIRPENPMSTFVWGGEGLGKSSCVSLPTALDSDEACLAVMDSSGALAKYSSGYRSKLGDVFYFNWALTDVPEKGEYWPRWNPVSSLEMPERGENRVTYIKTLVQCLFPDEKRNYWEVSSQTAMEGLLLFFASKIEQAMANDYFLSELLEKGKIAKADRELLESYYLCMKPDVAEEALKNLHDGTLNVDNYLPIGSWENVPELWRGKEFCLPMFADCLMLRYFAITQEDQEKAAVGGFKIMLGEFIKEARLFGYDARAVQIMQQLYYLTRRQRRIIFTMMLSPLMVFRKSNIRERTSLSDFTLAQMRGTRHDEQWRVTTVYSVADAVKSSAVMSRFLFDMLIAHYTKHKKSEGHFPICFVLDDFERLPKLSMLTEGLTKAKSAHLSFMMLTDGLHMVEKRYGVEELEDIISNSSIKLMMADNAKRMSEHFNKLAVFGTKSVQIPAVDAGGFSLVKKGLADANYYRRIAKDLMHHPRSVKFDKEHYLLLVEGFYHLPVNIRAANFLRDDKLRSRAACSVGYMLKQEIVEQRNLQDVEVPELLDVVRKSGINVETEDDIDAYLEDKYDEVAEVLDSDSDIQTVWAEEVSSRWNYTTDKNQEDENLRQKNDDWWMDEDAFKLKEQTNMNPFKNN